MNHNNATAAAATKHSRNASKGGGGGEVGGSFNVHTIESLLNDILQAPQVWNIVINI